MSNDVQSWMAAVTSWVAAILALTWTYQGQIMFILGLALAIARLIQEVPKAIQIIKGRSNRDGK